MEQTKARKKRNLARMLVLVTTPKLAERALKLYSQSSIPMHYRLNASGTASNEMRDILGLESMDKNILVSILPKKIATETLTKLRRGLKIGSVNSGIAFTVAITGASKLVLRILEDAMQHGTENDKRGKKICPKTNIL